MNFYLPFLPARQSKMRTHGLTMVMDQGLSYPDLKNDTLLNILPNNLKQ